jgi:hypothetical protein
LAGCAVCCAHCGIRFLTHPRNVERQDLYCPFGCRKHHRRECGNQRSANYYRTAAGKRKKKLLNAARSGWSASPRPPAQVDPPGDGKEVCEVDGSGAADDPGAADDSQPTSDPGRPSPPAVIPLTSRPPNEVPKRWQGPIKWELGGVMLTPWLVATSPMLSYVQVLLRLIDGLRLCRLCVVHWLLKGLRQRSILERSPREYVLRFLHLHPP